MRGLMRQLFHALGASGIFVAIDGEIAKSILLKEQVDVVVTDYRMKPISGIELAQWIRQDPASPNPDMPIVMASAFSEADQVVAAKNAGVDGFLLKPLNLKQLEHRLVAVLNAPRLPVSRGATRQEASEPTPVELDIEEFSI